jgi:hypothetical protein
LRLEIKWVSRYKFTAQIDSNENHGQILVPRCTAWQAADFKLAGHENFFPSKPKAESGDWDLLQTLDVRTLLFIDVVSGDGAVWDSAVASICADVENFSQLVDKLNHVKRTVCPTTHARNLIMPSQALIKRLLK